MKRNSADIPQPRWIEKYRRWQLDGRKEGKRKSFYSSNPSAKAGPAECRAKYRAWYFKSTSSSITIGSAWIEFSKVYREKNKITSYDAMQSRYKAHLKRLENRKLELFRKSDWQDIIYHAKANGADSYRTLTNISGMIRVFCKFCAGKGYIDDCDVPLYFDIPAKDMKPDHIIIQPKDFFMLMTHENDNWYIHAWRFLVLTGLRRAEICGLKTDRDYKDGRIYINETISHKNYLLAPKSEDSVRNFYPPDLAIEEWKKHIELRRKKSIYSEYFFCDKAGNYMRPRMVSAEWLKWRRANGIDMTLHELRHTFVSYVRQLSELALEDVKKIVGHDERMNTDATYNHIVELTREQQSEKDRKDKIKSQIINSIFENMLIESH